MPKILNTKSLLKSFAFLAILLVAIIFGVFFLAKNLTINGWFGLAASGVGWFDGNWSYRKIITIDHTKILADQSNFPILISITDTDLKNHALSTGYDIYFTDADGYQIPYEREHYISSTGTLVAWVNVPNLSSSEDTTLYINYGNPKVSADQQQATNVWDSDFVGVWHLDNPTSPTDSTSNANNGTNSGVTATTTGQIGRAGDFDGSGYISIIPISPDTLSGSFTVSFWAKVLDPGSRTVIGTQNNDNNDSTFYSKFQDDAGIYGGIGNGTNWIKNGTDVSLSYSYNTWYQITYAFTTTGYAIYLNGNNVASGSYSGTPLLFDSDHNVFIGQPGWGDEFFNGAIDEVRISDVARSAHWIKTEYNNENSPSTFYTLGSEESVPVYTLTYTAGAHGSISGTLTQTVRYGADGTPVTAVPDAGYHFVDWSDGSTVNPRTIDTAVTGNNSVTANFAVLPSVPGIPQATIGTNPTLQDWSWTASTDTGGPGVKDYLWRIDGWPTSGTTTTATITTNLPEGNWKFYVKAEDNAGNQSAESSSVLAVLASSVHVVTVDCTVPLVQIAVVDGVSNPYLDLSPLPPSGDLLTANINCEIVLKSLLPSATVVVDIPKQAVIETASTLWTKTIIPPITTAPATNLLPTNSQVALAILMGHNVVPLSIDRGIRILLGGQAGKKVGYISNNVFTEITNLCSDDSQDVGDALGTGQDCKVNSGSDLVIWTKHFTEFVAYTTASAVSQNTSSGSGGGMPAKWNNPPTPSAGGFGVSINNGVENTASPTVTLSLRGGSDTARMIISNSTDFKDARQENYATTTIWNLCWENSISETPSNCPDGIYTVYVKYYAPWGIASKVVSDSVVLKTSNQISQPFTRDLKIGQTSADVERLQIFLNRDFDTQIVQSGSGSPGNETTFFGYLTKAAVIKFQEKNASEILAPLGLGKGTGIVAKYTRAKMNKMLGF